MLLPVAFPLENVVARGLFLKPSEHVLIFTRYANHLFVPHVSIQRLRSRIAAEVVCGLEVVAAGLSPGGFGGNLGHKGDLGLGHYVSHFLE